MNILPLFSVPLYHNETNESFTDEINSVTSLNKTPAAYNKVSQDNDILLRNEFAKCKHVCEYHLNQYVRNTFNCSQEFYIINSWAAQSAPGERHGSHFHPNSIVSGVLYLQCEKDAGDIIFRHKSSLRKDFNFAYTYQDYNIFNSDTWKYTVNTGDILIFPGWVEHSVEENKSSKDRIVLGFNAFVRGEFGTQSNDYSSKLIL
tara:strand:- start:41 stop:649 length:609 start_codon:yes stop_codon:yes gene_type:complete